MNLAFTAAEAPEASSPPPLPLLAAAAVLLPLRRLPRLPPSYLVPF